MFSGRDERRIIDAVLRVEGMLRNQELARANPPCDAGVSIATRTQSGILTARGQDTRQLIGGTKNFDSPLEIELDEFRDARLNFRSSAGLVYGAVQYTNNDGSVENDDQFLAFMEEGATALRSSGLADSSPRSDLSVLGVSWGGNVGVGRFYDFTPAAGLGVYDGILDGRLFPVAKLVSGTSADPSDPVVTTKTGITKKGEFVDGFLVTEFEIVGGWVTKFSVYGEEEGSSDDGSSDAGSGGSSGGGGGSGTISPVAEGGAATTAVGSSTVNNVEVSDDVLLVVCLTAYDDAAAPAVPLSVKWNNLDLALAKFETLVGSKISASVWFLEVATGATANIDLDWGNSLGSIGYTIHAVEIGPPTLTGASQATSTTGVGTVPTTGGLTASGTCCTIGLLATAGPFTDTPGTWLNNFTGTGQRASEQMSGSENVTGDIAYNFSTGTTIVIAAKSGITSRNYIIMEVVFQ